MVVRKAHVLSVAVRIGTVRPSWFYYFFTIPWFCKGGKVKKQKKNRFTFAFAKPKVAVVVQRYLTPIK
jgi:hypothetical protein